MEQKIEDGLDTGFIHFWLENLLLFGLFNKTRRLANAPWQRQFPGEEQASIWFCVDLKEVFG